MRAVANRLPVPDQSMRHLGRQVGIVNDEQRRSVTKSHHRLFRSLFDCEIVGFAREVQIVGRAPGMLGCMRDKYGQRRLPRASVTNNQRSELFLQPCQHVSENSGSMNEAGLIFCYGWLDRLTISTSINWCFVDPDKWGSACGEIELLSPEPRVTWPCQFPTETFAKEYLSSRRRKTYPLSFHSHAFELRGWWIILPGNPNQPLARFREQILPQFD